MKTLQEYYRVQRNHGWNASIAFHYAKTLDQWQRLGGEVDYEGCEEETESPVRLRIVPDETMYDDSYIDSWSESDEKKNKIKEELWDRIASEGVWGIVGEYRTIDGNWEHADSVWGFIGNDWQNSGYDTDVMSTTLQTYRDQQDVTKE